jgi:hypothetical protein
VEQRPPLADLVRVGALYVGVVIVAAVVVPHPPLLLRELTGLHDVAADLRRACHTAVQEALGARPDAVVVVSGADHAGSWDPALPVNVRPFGTTGPPHAAGLPLGLGVASRLLDEVGWAGPIDLHTVRWDAGSADVADLAARLTERPGRVVLLVLGDGSARRGEKAPGYLDDRAFGLDAELGRALAAGDAAALEKLDPDLAEQLMVFGRAAFAVLGAAVNRQGGTPRARVLYADDPHGVMYHVALWDALPGAGA